MSVQERLLAILSELPAIGKNQKNPQQGFMFRGHDDILNALNPLLSKHGVFIVPDVVDRVTAQRTTAKGGFMYEVNLHVRFRFYGADGDHIEASTWGEGIDSFDKATNKAMTMAFKNVLNQTFAISSAEFKDPDGDTPTGDGSAAPSRPPATEKPIQKGQIDELALWVKKLDSAYPEAQEESWGEVVKQRPRDRWQKELTEVSMAEANELIRWCEDTFRDLMQENEVGF